MNMTKEEVARALSVLFHELTAHWTKEKFTRMCLKRL